MRFYSNLFTFLAALTSVAQARSSILNERALGSGSLAKRDHNSNNWCGMVKNASVTTVEATWVVPSISRPNNSGPNDELEAYQWVGIDGSSSSCSTLLQGGTGQYMYPNGTITSFFWYEFYPAPPTLLFDADGAVSGDAVHVKVIANSGTKGTIYLDNLTTGVSKNYKVTSTQGSLCFQSVEWIQEDVLPKVFPAFTTFDMTKCAAKSSTGTSINVSGAERWLLTKDGSTLCHPTPVSNTDVRFTYGA